MEGNFINFVLEEEVVLDEGQGLDWDLETFIESIQKFSVIYNKGDPNHKDSLYVENSWVALAALLRVSVDHAKKAWASLKRKYMRERKSFAEPPKSGASFTRKPQWHLYNAMRFLDNHVSTRKTTSNVQNVCKKYCTENLSSSTAISSHRASLPSLATISSTLSFPHTPSLPCTSSPRSASSLPSTSSLHSTSSPSPTFYPPLTSARVTLSSSTAAIQSFPKRSFSSSILKTALTESVSSPCLLNSPPTSTPPLSSTSSSKYSSSTSISSASSSISKKGKAGAAAAEPDMDPVKILHKAQQSMLQLVEARQRSRYSKHIDEFGEFVKSSIENLKSKEAKAICFKKITEVITDAMMQDSEDDGEL